MDVTNAKFQMRGVIVTYRQHIARHPGDREAAAAFRERALPLLDSVELVHGTKPGIAQLLADARHELEGGVH